VRGDSADAAQTLWADPPINTARIIDLTHTFDASTIYWPIEFPFKHEFEKYGETPGDYFYSSAKYSAPEHLGTHTDAPIHFNAHGITLDTVALQNCIGPAAVVDFSSRAATDPNATLSVDDLNRYEAVYGRIPGGAIVVARSGWSKFWPDKKRYMGTDKPGDVDDLRFPGFSDCGSAVPDPESRCDRNRDRHCQYRPR